jgi:hypothetical protein
VTEKLTISKMAICQHTEQGPISLPGFRFAEFDLVALSSKRLSSQPKATHDLEIAVLILAIEVRQMTSALSHQLQQPPSGVLIALVNLEMLDQLVDASGQQRDLYLRRPCVAGVKRVVLNDCILLTFR